MVDDDVLLEKLAALEHEQWMHWSMTLARKEDLSPERLKRWSHQWIPYDKLSEAEKEEDRKWARKILSILKEANIGVQ